jgi:dimethylhistidine N-methyltransferase
MSSEQQITRARGEFLADVLRGLAQAQKELPCKYFYDAAGSALFEQICDLDEYYLTRTELAIMRRHVAEMASLLGPDCLLIEYGSGTGTKTRLLLDRMEAAAYVPIDISPEYLQRSAAEITARYPGLEVRPLCTDFASQFQLPPLRAQAKRRIIYFPGSTIGNFGPAEAAVLLSRSARVVGQGGGFLLGFDLQKELTIIEAAYNDSRGVTRAFNLNLLARINRELGADFKLDTFRHCARYDSELNCIEMYLVSTKPQTVLIQGHEISFAKGESIRTERSYKYNLEEFTSWVKQTGFRVEKSWTDEKHLFAVVYLIAR